MTKAPHAGSSKRVATTPLPAAEAAWRRRLRAPRVFLPIWARDQPNRLLYASNATGVWELYAWDRDHDFHRQVTNRREGTLQGVVEPSGERLWWWDDTDGDEYGVWMVQPFDGGDDVPATAGLPRSYSGGLALGHRVAVIASSDAGVNRIHVLRDTAAPVLVYEHAEAAFLSGAERERQFVSDVSSDDRLFAFHHSEHGDARHPAVRVMTLGGDVIGELWDGPGLGLHAAMWSPVVGDDRLLLHHERGGRRMPMLWSPGRGERSALEVDLPGELTASWYPDATALLLGQDYRGRQTLHRLDLRSGRAEPLDVARGSAWPAAVRPDGEVWYAWSDAATPPQIRSTSGAVVLAPPGDPPPTGRSYRDIHVGDVHAFVAEPATPRPHPTVFLIHGGPEYHDSDEWYPPGQAWVDHGLALVLVNYRGSSGYGKDWRDAITGNPGLTELEDIAAVRDALVAEGVADPHRLVLAGGSWGGYLTLLGLGTQPDRWSAGVAVVPVGDYVAAYEDEMEPLKAYDRALFGASPDENPELYRVRNAVTYADRVEAPVLILAGENDPRCPIRGIDNYIRRLEEHGKEHEVLRFDAGHGSMRTDVRIRHLEAQLDFVARHLETSPPQ